MLPVAALPGFCSESPSPPCLPLCSQARLKALLTHFQPVYCFPRKEGWAETGHVARSLPPPVTPSWCCWQGWGMWGGLHSSPIAAFPQWVLLGLMGASGQGLNPLCITKQELLHPCPFPGGLNPVCPVANQFHVPRMHCRGGSHASPKGCGA